MRLRLLPTSYASTSYIGFRTKTVPATHRVAPLICLGLLALITPASAQLRPLDPVDFTAFQGSWLRTEVGVGVYSDQRASLAGTTGRLWELGNFRVLIRTGRMVVELGGTAQRIFTDEKVYDLPFDDAAAPTPDRSRHDAGDYRVAAIVRLSGDSAT